MKRFGLGGRYCVIIVGWWGSFGGIFEGSFESDVLVSRVSSFFSLYLLIVVTQSHSKVTRTTAIAVGNVQIIGGQGQLMQKR
jgi:hypothetical protein